GQVNLNDSDVSLGIPTPWDGTGDRSNNGDVTQSNEADTTARAKNGNETNQSNDQSQSADGGDNSGAGSGNDVTQNQSGTNTNGTTQGAVAGALTGQANLNDSNVSLGGLVRAGLDPAAIIVKDEGNRSSNGDVGQSNE